MMNILALSLILTSLATAGVFSPTPEKKINNNIAKNEEDVIVKGGHRTVVVEYENDDGTNTKVSISPPHRHDDHPHGKISDSVENAEEKLKEATRDSDNWATPREPVCDAFGKCKLKIASALGKTKEKVYEKAHEAADKVYEVEEDAKGAVGEALGKMTDKVSEKAREVSDKAHEAKEKVKEAVGEKAQEVSDKAHEAKEKVKEAVGEKAQSVKEGAEEKLKRGAKEAVDTSKTLKEDVEKNATRAKDSTKKKAKEEEEKVVEAGKHLKEILGRGGEVLRDVFGYVMSPESLDFSMGILQLLGFSITYGMSIWVTFISSYVLAAALPRQQFGMVQSKIYPVYFKAMASSIGMVLLGHLVGQRERLCSGGALEMGQCFGLLASLSMVLLNLFYLEPRATKIMFERMKMEKEEGRGRENSAEEPTARLVDSVTEAAVTRAASAITDETSGTRTTGRAEDEATRSQLIKLSKTLKKLNHLSSFLNILPLMALTWHLVYLGQRLHTAS